MTFRALKYLFPERLFRSTRASVAATLLVAAIILSLGVVLDKDNADSHRSETRQFSEQMARMLHERLTSRIDANLVALRHLSHASLAAEDREQFRHFAEQHIRDNRHIIGIGLAPGHRLQALYPESWNTDYSREAIEATIRRQLAADDNLDGPETEAGPRIGLADSRTLSIVIPVAGNDASAQAPGAIVVVMDADRFFLTASLLPRLGRVTQQIPGLEHLDFAIRQAGSDAPPFAGPAAIADADPVIQRFDFPGGAWELLVAPRAGWEAPPGNQLSFRLALLVGAIATLVPILVANLLIAERNRNIDTLKAREAKLTELSQRFNIAMDSFNIGIWEVHGDEHRLFWDERAAGLHGYSADDNANRLGDWLDSIVAEDRDKAEAHFFNCICGMAAFDEVYRVGLADGAVRYLRSAGSNCRYADGSVRTTGIVWDVTADMMMTETLRTAKEISEIKNAELELALDELSSREQDLDELSRRLDIALDSNKCGTWEANLDTGVERWDTRMCQLYGIQANGYEIKSEEWLKRILEEDRELAIRTFTRFFAGQHADPLVVRVPQADGSIRYIRSVGQFHRARDGARMAVGIAFDVTEDAVLTEQLKAAKQEADAKNAELELAKSRIEHNALHDPLTGLANRRKLDAELDQISKASRKTRQKFSILHLDLDRFKQINDTLGHAAGDAMLTHASRMLAQNLHDDDLVARIGGDEFMVLVQNSNNHQELAALANRIINSFRQPFDFEGFSCRCGISIGIATTYGVHIDARRTLVNADIALYRAKRMGRNRFEFFTQNLQAEIVNNKRTADEILQGLENGEFVSWYQPQFDARTMQLTGVEALVRWKHPARGILPPDQFLKIAEELNVVAALDQIVLENALKDKMRWAAMGICVPKVSVNVSSKRLHDESLIDILQSLSISPGEICFELVESIFLDESDDTASVNLERIKALGIDIEIDDFGTGHTSIVSLLRLRPKRLKIDRQLVMPILQSPQERALVRSIIDIARSLGVETVAEGVETLEHAGLLRQLGCDALQGYAFARPLSFDDFSAMASRQSWLKAS